MGLVLLCCRDAVFPASLKAVCFALAFQEQLLGFCQGRWMVLVLPWSGQELSKHTELIASGSSSPMDQHHCLQPLLLAVSHPLPPPYLHKYDKQCCIIQTLLPQWKHLQLERSCRNVTWGNRSSFYEKPLLQAFRGPRARGEGTLGLTLVLCCFSGILWKNIVSDFVDCQNEARWQWIKCNAVLLFLGWRLRFPLSEGALPAQQPQPCAPPATEGSFPWAPKNAALQGGRGETFFW